MVKQQVVEMVVSRMALVFAVLVLGALVVASAGCGAPSSEAAASEAGACGDVYVDVPVVLELEYNELDQPCLPLAAGVACCPEAFRPVGTRGLAVVCVSGG